MISVLLVDDHPIVRVGYQRLLEQAGDICVIAQAGEAETGYAAFVANIPDVCITDLSLPGAGGLELMRKILAHNCQAKVLIFSMYDSEELIRRAMLGGACGFVSKNASPDSLVEAVRATHCGKHYLSKDLSPVLLKCSLSQEAMRISSLTPREFEIFCLLAEGRSLSECSDILSLSLKTMGNNQTQIKEKLEVSTLAALVHMAVRNGIIKHHEP
jgi:DNA-binding NarL/FixJ family response regulator